MDIKPLPGKRAKKNRRITLEEAVPTLVSMDTARDIGISVITSF